MKRLLVLIYYSLGIIALRADLVMSLTANTQRGAGGTELVFSGTLTNTGATKLFLNDIVPSLNGSATTNLAFGPNSFFANVPGILLPGESYTDSELFRVLVNGFAPEDIYEGMVTLRGGADIQANDALGSAGFTVLSPDVSAALSLMPPTGESGYLTLSFTPNPAATNLNFIVEGSDELIAWDANKAEPISVQDPNPTGLQTYRYKTAIGLDSKGFLRVRVERANP